MVLGGGVEFVVVLEDEAQDTDICVSVSQQFPLKHYNVLCFRSNYESLQVCRKNKLSSGECRNNFSHSLLIPVQH